MGKSDNILFPEYSSMLHGLQFNSIAFLGFDKENSFTRSIPADVRHFYDLSLGNWEINSSWSFDRKYDLVVSTRCPYFSKNPLEFIDRCKDSLNIGGHALIDWGLGDHWRFNKFKVGWVRDGEHEFAYKTDNMLYSCMWSKDFLQDEQVQKFHEAVKGRFGYDMNVDLDAVIRAEVPAIISYEYKKIKFKFLWPDSPQLYIITLI